MRTMKNVHDNISVLIEKIADCPSKPRHISHSCKSFAKMEAIKQGHSTKDRIALYIIEAAERKELFRKVWVNI